MQVKEKCQKIMTEKNNGNSAAKEERLTEHVEKKSLHRQYNQLEKQTSEEPSESSEQNSSLIENFLGTCGFNAYSLLVNFNIAEFLSFVNKKDRPSKGFINEEQLIKFLE